MRPAANPFAVLLLAALSFGSAVAAPPVLEIPVRCTLGADCFIQNFFDHDASSGYRDYRCGRLSYDGHSGTDFRLKTLAAMRQGVAVVAAAAGVVRGTRDGEADVSIRSPKRVSVDSREAGNGVRIDHGDGWETQYSHLRQGSIRVKAGQRVQGGDVLGLIGLSGKTEFPHLDFTVRRRGRVVDPFAVEPPAVCGEEAPTLWSETARRALVYRPSGLLVAGFGAPPPSREEVESGEADHATLPATAPAIVFWAEAFGLREGDEFVVELRSPTDDGAGEQAVDDVMPGDLPSSPEGVNGSYWCCGSGVLCSVTADTDR